MALQHPSLRFVFHSKVAAQFYLKQSLVTKKFLAIRSDRFLSWDAFRDADLVDAHSLMAVDASIRTLFIQHLCRDPSVHTLLPDHDTAFISELPSLLPHLKLIRSEHNFEKLLYADLLKKIYEQYRIFLAAQKLYEARWVDLHFPENLAHTVFVLPELMPSFDSYAQALRARGSTMISHEQFLSAHRSSRSEFHRYEHATDEIKDTMLRISALLSKGVPPHDIVITVAGLSRYHQNLSAVASQYGILLRIAHSTSALLYPGSRIFSLLASLIENEFDCENFEALILDPSLKWKNEEQLRHIVIEGITHSCVRGSTAQRHDRWKQILTKSDLTYYTAFRGAVEALSAQSSFATLFTTLISFLHRYLEFSKWDAESWRALSLACQHLKQLANYEVQFHLSLQDHWQILLHTLREIYLGPPQTDNAIAVYAYTLTAGIDPPHHFILGCSHRDTIVSESPLSGISQHYLNTLNLETQYSTDIFLDMTLASGKNLCYSMSTHSFGKTCFPCLKLIGHHPTPPALKDPYDEEERWWKDPLSALPSHISRMQAAALSHMLQTGLSAHPTSNFRNNAFSSVSHPAKISVSALDRYRMTPFSYYLNFLGLKDRFLSLAARQALYIGSLMHIVLSKVLKGTLQPIPSQTLPHTIAEFLAPYSSQLAKISLLPERTVSSFIRILSKFLVPFLNTYTGKQVEACEKSMELLTEKGTVTGIIDLVISENGTLSIVDYKLSRRFSVTELRGTTTIDSLPSVQLPIYVLRMRQDASVEAATYWHIRQADSLSFFLPDTTSGNTKCAFSEKEAEALLDHLPSFINTTFDRIQKGDFRCPQPQVPCKHCSYRSICRGGFSTE